MTSTVSVLNRGGILNREPLILIDPPHGCEFLMAPFWQCGLTPEVRYRATLIELVRSMVAKRLGVSLLITQSPATSRMATVAERPIREATIRRPLVMARSMRSLLMRTSKPVAQCMHDAAREATTSHAGRRRKAETG